MTVSKENFLAQEAFKRLDAIGSQINELAPIVWEKMVTLVWAESIAMLGVGAFALITAIISIFWALKLKRDWDSRTNKHYSDAPPLQVYMVLAIFVPSIIALPFTILYPWNWVGAFAPEARLIARLLGALTQTAS